METCIHQKDKYGNPVLGFYEFDTNVVEEEMNLSIPLADMSFTEVMPGIQLCSFSLLEPGNFLFTISDTKHNRSISNMPFSFNVFIGECNMLLNLVFNNHLVSVFIPLHTLAVSSGQPFALNFSTCNELFPYQFFRSKTRFAFFLW
jgi:hypothetical protein